MSDNFMKLFNASKKIKVTEAMKKEHRDSFVYGNVKIENNLVTREMVQRLSELSNNHSNS
jgi:hypothetical protein